MSKLTRSVAVVYMAQALNGLLSVIAVPIAVKLLGVSGYGLLSIYTLLAGYILLADFGVSKNLLRVLAEAADPEAQKARIQTALGLYIGLAAVWLALTPLVAFAVPRYLFPVAAPYVSVVRWMAAFSVMEFILGIPASMMQTACVAGQRFAAYARYSAVTGFTRNGTMLAAAILFRSPEAIALALALRKILDTAIAGRMMGWIPLAAWRPVFHLRNFRSMLGQSVSLSVAQVLQSTAMAIGSPLVNAAFGLQGLGLYRAAFDLAGKIAVVSNGVTLVAFPAAARYFGSTIPGERAASAITVAARLSASAYACFAAAGVLAAPYLLPLIGLKEQTTTQLFILLIIAMSFNAHSLLGNELIQAAGRYGYNIVLNLAPLAAICLLFPVIKPAAGIMAAGWAWVGAALLSACLADAFLLTICNGPKAQRISGVLVKVIAAGACIGLAVREFGMVADTAALVSIVILLGLLGWSVRDVIPWLRGRANALTVDEPAAPVVCA
jgi:O-antigen/teichoic acid export membrane protein